MTPATYAYISLAKTSHKASSNFKDGDEIQSFYVPKYREMKVCEGQY